MKYLCARTIGGLWAKNEDQNAWIWVNDIGWRKLDTSNFIDLLIVASRAKMDGTAVDLAEETRGDRTYITQITPVPFSPSANEVSRGISECIYAWSAAYEQRGSHIVVRIQLRKDSAVTQAELDAAEPRWADGIRAKWSGHFACCDEPGTTNSADCPHACALTFEVQWVTENAHHVVAVHRGPGRADMLNWYHDDSGNDAAHEFGHMLGNVDEYPDPQCPNRSPVNTGTVMAVVTGPAVKRQVDFLCTALGDVTVTT
jgi:hypothetical protein